MTRRSLDPIGRAGVRARSPQNATSSGNQRPSFVFCESSAMSANSKKLLIIGSANYGRDKEGMRIDCIPWEKLSGLQNVSDYDLLLINLLGLRTEAERKIVD